MIIGDLNQVLSDLEKPEGCRITSRRDNALRNFLDDMRGVDVGCISSFSLRIMAESLKTIFERDLVGPSKALNGA